MQDPATRHVNHLPALLKLAFDRSGEGMADRDAERRSVLDKALREMMRAAGDLPVPDDLLTFVETLEQAAGEDSVDASQ